MFQLFEAPDGWKIFEIADTRRREGRETPPDGPTSWPDDAVEVCPQGQQPCL